MLNWFKQNTALKKQPPLGLYFDASHAKPKCFYMVILFDISRLYRQLTNSNMNEKSKIMKNLRFFNCAVPDIRFR